MATSIKMDFSMRRQNRTKRHFKAFMDDNYAEYAITILLCCAHKTSKINDTEAEHRINNNERTHTHSIDAQVTAAKNGANDSKMPDTPSL